MTGNRASDFSATSFEISASLKTEESLLTESTLSLNGSFLRRSLESQPSSTRFISARSASTRSERAKKNLDELNRIRFERLKHLYGRDDEIRALHAAFEGLALSPRRQNGKDDVGNKESEKHQQPLNMVTLAGHSGTGKSKVVREFQRCITKKDKTILSVSGKFYQHQRSMPYHAFTMALTDLVSKFSDQLPASDIEELREGIQKNYEDLLGLMPNLEDLFPEDEKKDDKFSEDTPSTSRESFTSTASSYDVVRSQARFRFAFSKFLSIVCQPKHKVILFLDDLQWIDQASLDLLEFMLLESGLEESLLIIGCYRDNEVFEHHAVQQSLAFIEESRGQELRHLRIGNLTLQDTHELITDLFGDELPRTKGLAKVAHLKTEGNVFFLLQFFTTLRDEGLISYNIGSNKWNWDVVTIQKSTMVSENVVSMLKEKMNNLDENCRRMLTILSFLGSSFTETVVDIIATGLENSSHLPAPEQMEYTNAILSELVDYGFLEVIQDRRSQLGNIFLSSDSKRTYFFAHDQIELAARSFQDAEVLPELSLEMARVLYSNKFQFNFDTMLFTIVDMFNRGRALIHRANEISLLVDLNFKAGQSALEASAFAASIPYLRTAIDLIPPKDRWDRWGEGYELYLKLQNSLIKAEYSDGQYDQLERDIDTIISAKEIPIIDKMTAHRINIIKLTYKDKKHKESIHMAVNVLRELGIVLRPGLGKLGIVGGLIKTKLLLKKISIESIMTERKVIDDKNKKAGISLITSLSSAMYASNPDLYATSTLKIMRWSLKYGVSEDTPRCIAFYGLILLAFGNIKAGTDACKIAMELAEEMNLMETRYTPTEAVYGFVYPWTEPMSSCAKQLMRGYKIGLEGGDQNNALMNICLYAFACLSLGKPLSSLVLDLADYAHQMDESEMELQRNFLVLTWQVVLNLLGSCDDPLSMDGEAMTEQEILTSAKETNNPALRAQLYCHKLQLCVYFGGFELGATLLAETRKIGMVNPGHPIVWRTVLFEGIVAFELLCRGNKKYKSVGTRSIQTMQKYVSNGNPNCVHILYLLKAEQEAASGKTQEAQKLFHQSVTSAARAGYVNDRALAHERCGVMWLRNKNEQWATIYLDQAIEAYSEIEAHGKIDHMKESYHVLTPKIDLSGTSEFLKRISHVKEVPQNIDFPSGTFALSTMGSGTSGFFSLENTIQE